MKNRVIICVSIVVALAILSAAWNFFDTELAPLFFNARVERLHEIGLPRIMVRNGDTIYCRMKADDFEFPLPPGAQAVHAILTSGGFDTVDGSIEARFGKGGRMTPEDYEQFLQGKVPVGGWVTAGYTNDGLLINFHYFGDR